jgi:hypothetical protein
MKQMRFKNESKQIIFSIFFLFILCFYVAAVASAASSVGKNRWEGSTLVYEVGVWRLNIEYLR